MAGSNRRALVAGPALLAAAAAGLQVFDPLDGEGIPCPFHAVTGLHCPGCGMTRAAALLLRGDVAGAAAHNVLLFPVLVIAVAAWAGAVLPRRTGWLPALSVLLVAFAVARNLPAFGFLAPPG